MKARPILWATLLLPGALAGCSAGVATEEPTGQSAEAITTADQQAPVTSTAMARAT